MVLLQLSQSQLTLLEQCPRKFQYIYLDQITAPIPPHDREHLTRGSQVHHLMHQHELQFPPELLQDFDKDSSPRTHSGQERDKASTAQIYQMAQALASAVPSLNESTVFRQSEYRLTLEWSGVMLTVVYDLLLLDAEKAHIFDWKTYLKPPQLQQLRQRLANHWQTKLYPFVLVETSNYSPDDVDIAYWFVKPQPPAIQNNQHQIDGNTKDMIPHQEESNAFESDCLTFSYSDRLHQQTHQELTACINKLQDWLEDYQQGRLLPQINIEQGLCTQCSFKIRCDRMEDRSMHNTWDELGNIATMPEIKPFSADKKPPK